MCSSYFARGLVCRCLFFFFFQAEDGIRDLVRSRGLGDVYKRQALVSAQPDDEQFFEHLSPGESALSVRDPSAFPSFVAFGVSCASGIKAVQPDLIEFQKQLSEWQDDLRAADSLETNRGRRLAGLDQLQSAAEILATAVGATVVGAGLTLAGAVRGLSLIHISDPTRPY